MFCSHCGYKLEDGMRVCPQCGTAAEKVNIIAENFEISADADIVADAELAEDADGYATKAVKGAGKALRKAHRAYKSVSEEHPAMVQKAKKKRYGILAIIAVIVIGMMALSFYKRYQNDVEELQTYLEQGLIDEARSKADSMSKWQAQKVFDGINHEIQSENNAYINKNAYDAGFYGALRTKVSALHEMEQLNEATVESMPDLQHCYEEAIQNDELRIAEEYLSFLREMQVDYDVSVEDKIGYAKDARSDYEKAKHKYESGSYQEAMDICQEIVPDESDVILKKNIAALLGDIDAAYSKAIEENMRRAIENEDYAAIYQYIKTAKAGNSDNEKYAEIENQYLDGALKEIKENISYGDFEFAYDICKAVAECMPDNDDVVNLFAETVQGYVKYLLASESIETAEEILAEGLGVTPDNAVLATLQERLDNDTWRLAYEVFLGGLHEEADTIEFTLYPVDKLEIPYLLVVTDNTYEFYKYDENQKSVELAASRDFEVCMPAEGLFFSHGETSEDGYFSTTTIEYWDGYSFDGEEFVSEYSLQKMQERHYEAFTNKTLSLEETYMKDNNSISESEYNKQVARIEKANGMATYSYNEDNINEVIFGQ